MKNIYMLSLLETYSEETDQVPTIVLVEYPEMYLHPQLQKTASEILYHLSKKNQVIFSTHSPNLIFNFNSRQIRQVILDENDCSVIRNHTDIGRILKAVFLCFCESIIRKLQMKTEGFPELQLLPPTAVPISRPMPI